jgi:hypothetical protein
MKWTYKHHKKLADILYFIKRITYTLDRYSWDRAHYKYLNKINGTHFHVNSLLESWR